MIIDLLLEFAIRSLGLLVEYLDENLSKSSCMYGGLRLLSVLHTSIHMECICLTHKLVIPAPVPQFSSVHFSENWDFRPEGECRSGP